MKKKSVILTACIFLLIAIPITAAAINFALPKSSSGKYERYVVDRIDFKIENTEFILEKTSSETEYFKLSFKFSAKKTQADFYAVLNSFDITGISYESLVFTSLTDETESSIKNLTLPAQDGEPRELLWQAEVIVPITQKGTLTPQIEILYESGITKETSSEHLLTIPLEIVIK